MRDVLKRYLILLMVMVLVQPIGAMDQDSSDVWSLVKKHPVIATTTVVAYAVTAAGLGYYGSELWTARQNRLEQTRHEKLDRIVRTSQKKDEIKKAIADAHYPYWLKSQLEGILLTRLLTAISNGNKDEATLCLESSSAPRAFVCEGSWSTTAAALAKDQKDIIALFMNYGLSQETGDAQPLLIRAAAIGAANTVAWLLESKADPNVQNLSSGCTALHEAVRNGKKDVIPLLVTGGVDVNAVDKQGKCALDYAWRTPAHVGDIMPILECETLTFDAEKYAYLLPLMAAARNLKAVQWLLAHDVQANAVEQGFTAMHCAARSGNTELLSLLLDHHPRFADSLDRKVPTPLMLAAGNGHVAAIQLLFESSDFHPAEVDASGHDALCYAAGNGHYFAARLLYEYQTHRCIPDKSAPRTFPVHAAINGGHYDIAAYLIDQGCPLTTQDNLGDTPLHSYLKNPRDEGFLHYLIEKSTSRNINELNNAGETPLDVACAHNHGKAIEMLGNAGARRAAELAKDMEQHDQQPQEPTADKAHLDNILQHSTDSGFLKSALNQGGDRSVLSNRLLVAVQQDNRNEAEICLQSGIRPPDEALMIAIDNDKKPIIAVFAKYGITALTIVDSQPVLLRALKKGAKNTVTFLLQHGKEDILPVLEHPEFNFADHTETFLHDLAKAGHVNAIGWLIERGIDADLRDSEGYRLIHRAAEGGQTNVIELCLGRRKSDATWIGPNNVTPIMLAAGSGSVEAVQLLWDNDGFHPGAADDNHMTPLAHAAAKGHLEVVQRLVLLMKDLMKTYPCSLDGSYANKATPLHHAIYNEKYDVATYLLEQGASTSWLDAKGDTPLFAAVQRKFDEDFMRLIIDASKDQLNVLNKDGHPVSFVALQYANRQAYDMLIAAGAKTTKEIKELAKREEQSE